MYLPIESDLEYDPNTTKHERALLQQLKDGVSRAILSIRQKIPNADLGGARVALSGLQSCIERRTGGVDGYPLRR
jgi:hypothetical protein